MGRMRMSRELAQDLGVETDRNRIVMSKRRNENRARGESSDIEPRQWTRMQTFKQSQIQGVVRTQVAEPRHVIEPPKKAYLRRPDGAKDGEKTAMTSQRDGDAEAANRTFIEEAPGIWCRGRSRGQIPWFQEASG